MKRALKYTIVVIVCIILAAIYTDIAPHILPHGGTGDSVYVTDIVIICTAIIVYNVRLVMHEIRKKQNDADKNSA